MNRTLNQLRPGSMKLDMLHALGTAAMTELQYILRDCSIWVPDPDDCRSIGFVREDELAQVKWSFDRVLETLSSIDDANWSEQHPDVVPPGLLAHLQQAASPTGSDWLHPETVRAVIRIHEHVLGVANWRYAQARDQQNERLMYGLCSEAVLGIYTYMEDSTDWQGGLEHYELLDAYFTAHRHADCCLEHLARRSFAFSNVKTYPRLGHCG